MTGSCCGFQFLRLNVDRDRRHLKSPFLNSFKRRVNGTYSLPCWVQFWCFAQPKVTNQRKSHFVPVAKIILSLFSDIPGMALVYFDYSQYGILSVSNKSDLLNRHYQRSTYSVDALCSFKNTCKHTCSPKHTKHIMEERENVKSFFAATTLELVLQAIK